MADEPTDIQQSVSQRAATGAKDDRGHFLFRIMLLIALVGVLAEGGLLLATHIQAAELAAEQSYAATTGQQLANQVRALGAKPVVVPPTPVQGQTGATGPTGPGPTQQEIDDSVSRYLAAHPPANGQNATPGMVAAAVAAYLTANPPQPGRPPTADEISAAASAYIQAHASDFQGATGATGQAGADATDAQVAAAVSAYCSAHNDCAGATGPTGAQGAQGASITDLAFVRDSSGQCQVVVTLHDPASNTDSTVTHAAGDAACPLINPTSASNKPSH